MLSAFLPAVLRLSLVIRYIRSLRTRVPHRCVHSVLNPVLHPFSRPLLRSPFPLPATLPFQLAYTKLRRLDRSPPAPPGGVPPRCPHPAHPHGPPSHALSLHYPTLRPRKRSPTFPPSSRPLPCSLHCSRAHPITRPRILPHPVTRPRILPPRLLTSVRVLATGTYATAEHSPPQTARPSVAIDTCPGRRVCKTRVA